MDRDIFVSPRAAQRQEAVWTCIHNAVQGMVVDLIQRVLEWEQEAHLGAAWNQRSDARQGYRNGYRSRRLVTPYGPLDVKVPRCRDVGLDCSLLFDRYQRRVADVDRILLHAYLLGVSTRGTAELTEQVFGNLLSHQTVSQLTRWLQEQLDLWRRQPIEPVYSVVYLDGMHVNARGGDRTVMLAAGQRENGTLEVLGFCLSTGEQCRSLLQNLRDRGLENVRLFVSDESGAIRSALGEVYPEVAWQHCTFHRLSALREKVGPTDYRDLLLAEAACAFRCPSQRAAVDAAIAWAHRWAPVDAGAVRQFVEGLEDSLTFYHLPAEQWQRVRTNNPLERLIRTLRMRLDLMGCFYDEPAVERAVFGQLARWHLLGTYTQ